MQPLCDQVNRSHTLVTEEKARKSLGSGHLQDARLSWNFLHQSSHYLRENESYFCLSHCQFGFSVLCSQTNAWNDTKHVSVNVRPLLSFVSVARKLLGILLGPESHMRCRGPLLSTNPAGQVGVEVLMPFPEECGQ